MSDTKQRLRARIEELEARLEITHLSTMDHETGETIRHELTEDECNTFPDAVACRDATIALLDDRIEKLEAKLAAAMEALEPFAKAGELFDGTPDDMAKSFGVYVPAAGPGYHISGAHVKRARAVIRAMKQNGTKP